MSAPLTILGIAGSLRKESFNKSALRAAVKLAPEGVKIETFNLEGIPSYNQDLDATPPAIVTAFKAKIRAADAILFSTPEYNYSIPGVLKNAIDWASRPYGDSAWDGKPAAIMSASGGMLGGARAQYHLRQVAVFLNLHMLNRPEAMIPNANNLFDKDGNLKDEKTEKAIKDLVAALAEWTRKLKGA